MPPAAVPGRPPLDTRAMPHKIPRHDAEFPATRCRSQRGTQSTGRQDRWRILIVALRYPSTSIPTYQTGNTPSNPPPMDSGKLFFGRPLIAAGVNPLVECRKSVLNFRLARPDAAVPRETGGQLGDRAKADVVKENHDDIGSAFGRFHRLGKVLFRVLEYRSDSASERRGYLRPLRPLGGSVPPRFRVLRQQGVRV